MSDDLPLNGPPRSPAVSRWLVAVVMLAPALVPLGIGVLSLGSDLHGADAIWWPAAAVAVAVALVARSRHPVAAWWGSMAVVVSGLVTGAGPAYVLLLVVPSLPLISLTGTVPVRRSLAAALVTVVGLAGVGMHASPAASESASVALRLAVALPVTVTATAWLIGYALRVRKQYHEALIERARWLERERDARAAQAVAEERTRIARELHDVVGHHVTVMVVQAEGAEAVWDVAPDRARAAVEHVVETGREAMRELRETLRMIRGPEEETAGGARRARDPGVEAAAHELRAPVGLRGLSELVERVRAAGLDVEVTVDGDLEGLDPAVDLAALRIVQEALTNVLRHARARRVVVVVAVGAELRVRIVDDGVGLPPSLSHPASPPQESPAAPPLAGQPAAQESPAVLRPPTGSGRGLAGMRERVAVLGGTIVVGAGAAGGTAVDVALPVSSAEPASARGRRSVRSAAPRA